jgi:hypothetical protein
MMNRGRAFADNQPKSGDAAVAGLLAGLGAGMSMALALVVINWFAGGGAVATFGPFDPAGSGNWVTGLLTHLAVSGIYGMLFAQLMVWGNRAWSPMPRASLATGLVYSGVLLLLAWLWLLPAANAVLRAQPFLPFALGHAVYGATLGAWLGREWRYS